MVHSVLHYHKNINIYDDQLYISYSIKEYAYTIFRFSMNNIFMNYIFITI